ncbi:MAG: hypothetical protein O3B31_07890 [Chloroflexi bacterium]|nr:hypothetical protein [Chloroflexota bacterium]
MDAVLVVTALGAFGVSLVSLIVSVRTAGAATRANTIGARANTLAEEANRTAIRAEAAAAAANALSAEANKIAEGATVEAARSADAADGSLAIQRREAAAAQGGREAALKADVTVICWDTRARSQEMQGTQVKNLGPAPARNVIAIFQHGGGFSKATHHVIAAGDIAITRQGFLPSEGVEGAEPPLADGQREVSARVWWTNADNSPGDSGWLKVPRY